MAQKPRNVTDENDYYGEGPIASNQRDRISADPRRPLPKKKAQYAGAQLVGKDRPPTYRSMAPGNMARAAKKQKARVQK